MAPFALLRVTPGSFRETPGQNFTFGASSAPGAASKYSLGLAPKILAVRLYGKRRMKALLFWWDETQHELAREALRIAQRSDLIGTGRDHLIPPARARARGRGRGRTARERGV